MESACSSHTTDSEIEIDTEIEIDNKHSNHTPHFPPHMQFTPKPRRAGLMCANPNCYFMVHADPKFGGYWCKQCYQTCVR